MQAQKKIQADNASLVQSVMEIERRQAETDTAIVPGSTSQTQTKVSYENDMHSMLYCVSDSFYLSSA